MKRALYMAVLGLLLGGNAAAQGKKLKIGVVHMERAVGETNEGKAAEEQLRKLKQSLEAKLNRKLKEFYEREEKVRKAWSVLKEDEKRKRARGAQEEFQALQKEYLEAERELAKRKAKAISAITQKLSKIIQVIAQRESYDYIFNNAAVLWAPRHVDLTNEVIRKYNDSR